MFIERLEKAYRPGKPIFTEDILLLFPEFTKAYVFRLLKKAENNNELVRFSRGVYCLPKHTFFGRSSISSSMVANDKYIGDGNNVIGLYSGLSLLNQFAISTQVPNVVEIVTNNEATRKRQVEIGGMKFIIRKSRFEITKDNYSYYTILQLFLELGINPRLNDFSKQRIKEYISSNNMDQKRLIKYAMLFPARVAKNLLGSGVLYGTIPEQRTL